MGEPGFWDNTETAQKLINETNSLKEKYQQFHQLSEELDELTVMFELQQEEYDAEIQEELEERIHLLQERLTTYELSLLLNEPYDHNNALIELHPGAGGTESQDWEVCFYECIHVGQKVTVSKLKRWITKLEMKQGLKVSPY